MIKQYKSRFGLIQRWSRLGLCSALLLTLFVPLLSAQENKDAATTPSAASAPASKAVLKPVIKAVRQLAAAHRGETTAEVTSAFPLNDDQVTRLKANLKARLGREVAIDSKVDPQILGGIIIRHGSQMIDASIRTKLNTLAQAMKG